MRKLFFPAIDHWQSPHVATPRRFIAFTTVGIAIAGAVWLSNHATDQSASAAELAPLSIRQATADKPLTLRDRLIVGLQARLKSEVQFIDFVVMLVHQGDVPQRLVDETFFWARQRAARPLHGRPRRPIRYFQPGMTARLRRLGIDV